MAKNGPERKFEKVDLKKFSPIFVDSMYSEVAQQLPEEDGAALDIILNLLHLGFTGKGTFSESEIKVAYNGQVSSARDAEDALRLMSPSKTPFVVWSQRVYVRNFDKKGSIVTSNNHDVPDVLRTEAWQLRVLNMWLGNNQGEPEQRASELLGLMNGLVGMESQVRQSFSNIDMHSKAVQKLDRTRGEIARIPAEALVVQLEHVLRPANATRGEGAGYDPKLAIESTWELGGEQTFIAYQPDSGRRVYEAQMNLMRSSELLSSLPVKIDQASRAYGPKDAWFKW